MIQLPKRESLVVQVVQILRQGIQGGAWSWRLPGERALCARLRVSRPTLRAALAALRREGLIRTIPRTGNRICIKPGRRQRRSAPKAVGLLSMGSLDVLTSSSIVALRGIERHLHAVGYELDAHVDSRLRESRLDARLRNLVAQTRVACWLLWSVSERVQQWFMNRQIPALVAGSCYPGVQLPWFDVDYQAVCRHATQMLLKMGHRRIAFVTVGTGFAGDFFSKRGFHEAFEKSQYPDGSPRMACHDGTAGGVKRIIDRLLISADPPTALLVSHARHALTAASYFIQKGIRLPQQVSLVCRDDDDFLADFTPSIARYVFDWNGYAGRCSRALLQLATAGTLKARQSQIMPRFLRGETLASPKQRVSGNLI